ncbi:hypothetical protein M8J77_025762 [Diaphorina citri]|nr:hypothetical protein M8J77_025762 [Diaphorina citri]
MNCGAANHFLSGLQPLWFHASNVVLHAIASVLFTRLVLVVVGLEPRYAMLAGLVFATHPIHTEAVAGVVGRADILACIFFLLSFLSYHETNNKAIDVRTYGNVEINISCAAAVHKTPNKNENNGMFSA